MVTNQNFGNETQYRVYSGKLNHYGALNYKITEQKHRIKLPVT